MRAMHPTTKTKVNAPTIESVARRLAKKLKLDGEPTLKARTHLSQNVAVYLLVTELDLGWINHGDVYVVERAA